MFAGEKTPAKANIVAAPVAPTITVHLDTLTSSSPVGNQWYFNGAPIVGATSQILVDTAAGVYTVVYTNMYGCYSESLPYTMVGIDEFKYAKSEVSISPNPFTLQTTLTFSDEQKNTTIKIMDVPGKEIKLINVTGKQCVIEKEDMKPGIYFLQITDEKKNVLNKKIIIQ